MVRSPKASARDLLRPKLTIADYDYYADRDKYVTMGEAEEEARRLAAEIIRDRVRAKAQRARARAHPARDPIEFLTRLTMTPQEKRDLAATRRMFGNMDISDDILLKLQKAGGNVVPVTYYECPAGWKEYVDVSEKQIKEAGVVWQNKRGNFCLPKGLGKLGDKADRVDAYPNRLPSEGSVRRQLQNQLRLLRQMDETPEETAKRLAKEARIKAADEKREERIRGVETRAKEAWSTNLKSQEVRNLMEILRELPTDTPKTDAELKEEAKKLYNLAYGCASQSGGKQADCGKGTAVNGEVVDGKCSYGVGGSCYPKQWAQDAKDQVKAIKEANKYGLPLRRSQAEKFAKNEAMVEWWQDYYPRVRAHQKAEKAKTYNEDSIVRSLMSA